MSDCDYRSINTRARIILARFVLGVGILVGFAYFTDSFGAECEPPAICA